MDLSEIILQVSYTKERQGSSVGVIAPKGGGRGQKVFEGFQFFKGFTFFFKIFQISNFYKVSRRNL